MRSWALTVPSLSVSAGSLMAEVDVGEFDPLASVLLDEDVPSVPDMGGGGPPGGGPPAGGGPGGGPLLAVFSTRMARPQSTFLATTSTVQGGSIDFSTEGILSWGGCMARQEGQPNRSER
jgi:hypothetical protein